MSKEKQYRLAVYIRGLEYSRGQVCNLVLRVDGVGAAPRPIRLKLETTHYELALPAGMYFLGLTFRLGRRRFSRTLSAIKVPTTASVQFDLSQAVTDGLFAVPRPAINVSHRALARKAGA